MMEEGGDGNGDGNRTIPGSEEEDTLSVGPEPSVASSISDSSSIASATDEFSSFDAYSETETPSSVARPALTVSVGVPPAVCAELCAALGPSVHLRAKAGDGRCCGGGASLL